MNVATDADPNAESPLAPGPLLTISRGSLQVAVAPEAGGRIAQICREGVDHLIDHASVDAAMIAWGSFPMVPWAGRVRDGRFQFAGCVHQLALNLPPHAIHGVGFGLPWCVETHEADLVELSLALPEDERWPFGGIAHQRVVALDDCLQMTLSLRAGAVPMPAVIGWHPWFRKPDRLTFLPRSMYPRDAAGIATMPLTDPTPGPWDDCFINHDAVLLEIDGQRLRLTADCDHWVVYDATTEATCIEPQTGPPDAFNLQPNVVAAGATMTRTFCMAWQPA